MCYNRQDRGDQAVPHVPGGGGGVRQRGGAAHPLCQPHSGDFWQQQDPPQQQLQVRSVACLTSPPRRAPLCATRGGGRAVWGAVATPLLWPSSRLEPLVVFVMPVASASGWRSPSTTAGPSAARGWRATCWRSRAWSTRPGVRAVRCLTSCAWPGRLSGLLASCRRALLPRHVPDLQQPPC
jgi:hypothetical protein